MKNLILMGSPRKDGSSAYIAQWFAGKLEDHETLNVSSLEINPCNGCNACKDLGYCIIRDSMDQVYQKVKEAEQFIIVTPIYFLGMPSAFKALIDRTQVFWHRPQSAQKKALIFMVGEKPNSSLKDYYHKIWDYTLINWGVKEIKLEVLGNIFQKEEIQENILIKSLRWLEKKQ